PRRPLGSGRPGHPSRDPRPRQTRKGGRRRSLACLRLIQKSVRRCRKLIAPVRALRVFSLLRLTRIIVSPPKSCGFGGNAARRAEFSRIGLRAVKISLGG